MSRAVLPIPQLGCAFARHGHQPALVLDRGWRVVWANEAATAQMEAGLVGLPLVALLDSAEAQRASAELATLDAAEGVAELSVHLRDGRAARLTAWREADARGALLHPVDEDEGMRLLLQIIGGAEALGDEGALRWLVSDLTQFFGLDLGTIARLEGDQLRLVHAFPASLGPEGATFPRRGSCCGLALRQVGRTTAVADLPTPRSHGSERARAYIGHPLVVAGEVVGTLGFSSGRPRIGFHRRQRELVSLAARWVQGRLTRRGARPWVPGAGAVIRAMSGVVLLTDADARVIHVSRGFERVLGYRGSDVVGQPVQQLLGRAPLAPGPVPLAVQSGHGALITGRAVFTEIIGPAGRPVGMVITLAT